MLTILCSFIIILCSLIIILCSFIIILGYQRNEIQQQLAVQVILYLQLQRVFEQHNKISPIQAAFALEDVPANTTGETEANADGQNQDDGYLIDDDSD